MGREGSPIVLSGAAGASENPSSDGEYSSHSENGSLVSVSSEFSPRSQRRLRRAADDEADAEDLVPQRAEKRGSRKRAKKIAPPDPEDDDIADAISATATAQKQRQESASKKRQARKEAKAKTTRQRAAANLKLPKDGEAGFLASRVTGTVAWGASLCFVSGAVGTCVCRLCSHVVKIGGPLKQDGTRSYTASNLVSHLNGPHKNTWLRIQEKLGAKNSDDVTSYVDTLCAVSTKDSKISAKADASIEKLLLQGGVTHRVEVNLAFLAWLVDSQIPFNAVEGDTFKTFLNHSKLMVDSSFKMKESLGIMLDIVKAEARQRLSKCPGVSLTFDLWTSVAASKYLIITYQGVMLPEFERVHHVLDLVPVEGASYGSLIAEILESRIDANVGGLSHILSLTSDNGANVKLARQLVGVDEVPCFAHGLKGVIDIVFGESGPEELVAEFRDDAAVSDFYAMKAVCDVSRTTLWVRSEIENEDYLTTISDNVTRWDGKYLSLERFLQLKEAFQNSSKLIEYFNNRFDGKVRMPADLFSAAFYRRLAAYKEILLTFHAITRECQGEGITAAVIPHFIWKLKKACKDDGSDFAMRLCGAVKARLEKQYLTGNATIVLEAAFLDPRYSQEVRKNVGTAKMETVWSAIIGKEITVFHSDEAAPIREYREGVLNAAVKLLAESMDAWVAEQVKGAVTYDGLDYWRARQQNTSSPEHNFVKIAAYYFSSCATSAASERGFSSTTGTLTKKRNRMSDELLEKLTVVRDFMRQDCYKFSAILNMLKERVSECDQPAKNVGKRTKQATLLVPGKGKEEDE
jgi:hypothetical protein